MRKAIVAGIFALLAAVSVLLSVSCLNPVLQDKTMGSLRILIPGVSGVSKGLVARAISGNVTAVEVKMTNDLYAPRMAQGSIGSAITIANVKVGTWKVELYLNDSSGNQLYYGSDLVTISAGASTSASIAVFQTGSAAVSVVEGVSPPTFTAGTPDMAARTYPLTISFPPDVATGSTNNIKYTIGTGGSLPADPTVSLGTSINTSTSITLNFDDTIKAIIVIGADARTSTVQTFSYTLPYFSLAQGSYTGEKDVTLQSMRPNVTIRYTVSSAAPGENPTYENGIVGSIGTVVHLEHPTSILKAVSYIAGSPATISGAASATYTLNVAPAMKAYINGSTPYGNGEGTLDFGLLSASSGEASGSIYLSNEGNGQDLVLPFVYAAITGDSKFSLATQPSEIQHTIQNGAFAHFDVRFNPSGVSGPKTGTLTIYSNDPAAPSFTVALTAAAYTAPTVSLLSGLAVEGAGYTNVNGAYSQVSVVNGYAGYQINGSNYAYVYYNGGYNIGYSTGYGSINDAKNDGYSSSNVKYYRWDATPFKLSSQWTSNGAGTAPDVTCLNGLGGLASTNGNAAAAGYMVVGKVLQVYYSATAGLNDTVATPTFAWYRKPSGQTTWTSIGSDSPTYTLVSADITSGTQIKVEVTPKSGNGLSGSTNYAIIGAP